MRLDATSLKADINFSSAKTKVKWLTKLILIHIAEIDLHVIGV